MNSPLYVLMKAPQSPAFSQRGRERELLRLPKALNCGRCFRKRSVQSAEPLVSRGFEPVGDDEVKLHDRFEDSARLSPTKIWRGQFIRRNSGRTLSFGLHYSRSR